jgi:predicted nucleic acid-binding Zn ribbon protein
MPGADPSWRRVMVSARTDWQRKQHACREALVESRLRHRRDLLRFVSQGGCAARPTSEPSAQVVCDHAIAGPADVRRCSLVCREYAVADLGRKRVIQRRFNLSVPRARVPETAPKLRERSER